eukprot:m.10994 g.10994  ORF g.10994 m.10994 type:complete len:537 (+) comp8592_c0_seq1:153-1763(+)
MNMDGFVQVDSDSEYLYTDTDDNEDEDESEDEDEDDNTDLATEREQTIAIFTAFEDTDHISAATISFVISGESNTNAKYSARYIAERITQDEESDNDEDPFDNSIFFESASELVRGLLQMLETELRLPFLDEYVMLLTALRQNITREVQGDSEHIINNIILENTPMLLRVFELAFASDPDGLAGPELVSMWSSILSEEGRMLCSRFMQTMEETLFPCILSNTVGSIVAIQVVANLNGDKESTLAKLEPLFPQIQRTFQAVFTGELHAERMWGPGPVTKCIAQLSSLKSVQQRIVDSHELEGPRDVLKGLENVLTFDKDDWPVKGFAAGYYDDARASACKVFYNISQNHDVLSLRPTLKNSLENLLRSNNDSPKLSAAGVTNATAALIEIAKYKLNVTADVLGQNIAESLTGNKISIVFIDEKEKDFCHKLANDLTQTNKKAEVDICSVHFHAHTSASAVLVVVLPSSKLHISDNDHVALQFALSLRKRVVVVENDQVLFEHVTKINHGQKTPLNIICINKTNSNLVSQLLTQVLFV